MLGNFTFVGAWRSLVAHLNGVQGVGGSNPLAPTKNTIRIKGTALQVPFLFCQISCAQYGGQAMVTLYVLKGETGKRYVGITNDLSRRIKEHRSQRSKGGQLLGNFSVLYTEILDDYATARTKEKFLKSGQGRKWLDNLEAESKPAIQTAGKARL